MVTNIMNLFWFLLGIVLGCGLWQWFGRRAVNYALNNPQTQVIEKSVKSLNHDNFNYLKTVVEQETLRRKIRKEL